MPDSTSTTTETRKTPADFQVVADSFNSALADALERLEFAQARLDEISAQRNALVAKAPEYGLTPAYARIVLRKP